MREYIIGSAVAAGWLVVVFLLFGGPEPIDEHACTAVVNGNGDGVNGPCVASADGRTFVIQPSLLRESFVLFSREDAQPCPNKGPPRLFKMGSAWDGWHCCESAQGAEPGKPPPTDIRQCRGERCCLSPGSIGGCGLSRQLCYPDEGLKPLKYSVSVTSRLTGGESLLYATAETELHSSTLDHNEQLHVIMHEELNGYAMYKVEIDDTHPHLRFGLNTISDGWSAWMAALYTAAAGLSGCACAALMLACGASPRAQRCAEQPWLIMLLLLLTLGTNNPAYLPARLLGGSRLLTELVDVVHGGFVVCFLTFLLLATSAVLCDDPGALERWHVPAVVLSPILMATVVNVAESHRLVPQLMHSFFQARSAAARGRHAPGSVLCHSCPAPRTSPACAAASRLIAA